MRATTHHNPRCAKSRPTLALPRERGIERGVVESLKNPPVAVSRKRMLDMLGVSPRELSRARESARAWFGDPASSAAAVIDGMVADPVVIEGPIVIANGRAAPGRPPMRVLEIR